MNVTSTNDLRAALASALSEINGLHRQVDMLLDSCNKETQRLRSAHDRIAKLEAELADLTRPSLVNRVFGGQS